MLLLLVMCLAVYIGSGGADYLTTRGAYSGDKGPRATSSFLSSLSLVASLISGVAYRSGEVNGWL